MSKVNTIRIPRVKTPTLLQMEALECGAAALGIILAYYGRYVPLDELREDCGVSRGGSKALNILKAGRHYNMECKGLRMGIKVLSKFKLPVILFWNFNHYVVLEGINGDKVYINDPATGPRKVSFKEFDKAFTGIVLTFKPSPEFEKGGEKPSTFQALRRRLTIAHTGLVFAVLAGVALVIPGLVVPVFSKIFVDNILVEGSRDWVRPLLLGMLLTALLRAGLNWIQQQTLLRQQSKLAIISSAMFYRHVLRLPINFFTQRYGGEIGNRLALNDTVSNLLTGSLASTVISIFTAIFFAVLMMLYDPMLTLIGLFFASTNVIILRWVNRKRADLQQRELQESGKLLGMAMNGLQMIETIKASSSESDFYSRWSGQLAKLRNASQEMERWTTLLMPIPTAVTSLSTAVVLGVGSLRVMDGDFTVGMLVAFQSLMASFLAPFNSIVELGTELQTLKGDMNRLDDVTKHEEDPLYEAEKKTSNKKRKIIRLSGMVEFKGVTFGFSKFDEPLIKDFNLTLMPGSRVALIGSSGSGKSTIAKLISGIYEPWEGEILFDGIPRKDIPRDVFLNSFSFVDQEIIFFQGSIRDNITMWNHTIPDQQIVRAAKDGCIHEIISTRPGGYHSMLDENGANLSSGQRQRLEIARSLASDPSIVVLDEATSAMDTQTEKRIDCNLRRRGCTCLIVAHRLSTIRDCNEIVMLSLGKIVARGKHDELIRQDGPYSQLIKG